MIYVEYRVRVVSLQTLVFSHLTQNQLAYSSAYINLPILPSAFV